MLKKSKTSALIMAVIAVFVTVITFLLLEHLFFVGGESLDDIDFGAADLLMTLGAFLLVSLFIILPGAYVINGLDESHFGVVGGVRWAFFGLLAGALATVAIHIVPSIVPEDEFFPFVVNKAIRVGLGVLILGFSYWCTFRMSRLFGGQ